MTLITIISLTQKHKASNENNVKVMIHIPCHIILIIHISCHIILYLKMSYNKHSNFISNIDGHITSATMGKEWKYIFKAVFNWIFCGKNNHTILSTELYTYLVMSCPIVIRKWGYITGHFMRTCPMCKNVNYRIPIRASINWMLAEGLFCRSLC